MAVGGMGMLSTSNYAARKFGVRAAMPGTVIGSVYLNVRYGTGAVQSNNTMYKEGTHRNYA